ncbi:MAG: DUF4417 domain-containing protein [Oscillospiraceae bacterium]|nr:DUF4417 domain-containing protein [Oscillospiraceae bacterium]
MTEENYNYRTSQTLLRNQFPGKGKLQIPIIPKFESRAGDFDDLLLIGFDKTHLEDQNHLNRMVHFFLYDYRFERVWKSPDNDIEKLSRYRAVLSPDFSMYLEMAPVMQLYNVFRNRWCGAYWASKGIRVIPTVNWGDESTFDFCFEGVEKGSTVAVSTYMASEHDNRKDQKEWFMAGYNEMLHRIEPERIICYNTPFPEMQGNIVFVDYERSSWRHMAYERSFCAEDLDAFKIGGTTAQKCDTMEAYRIGKGGGSAFGGEWRPNPNKPNDSRYLGNPGEIKTTIMKNGDVFKTKIGDDGRAEKERHETNHNRGDKHTNPHDHIINWNNPDKHPELSPPINYPSGAPEFKQYERMFSVDNSIIIPDGSMNFETISEFKRSIKWGAEIEFVWNGITYGIVRYGTNQKITIYRANRPETEMVCETADDALEYMVGTDRLRDVITRVNVISRTI